MGNDGSALARHWTLDPEVVFLNHGSFGACPSAVLEHQSELRARLERDPVDFLARRLESLLDGAREEAARFVGAEPEGLVFVPNATAGVNAVLGSLALSEGDELLVTDHEYNACRNVLDHVARRAAARVRVVSLPFPLAGGEEVVARVLEAVTARTRIALLDHVTSPTGLVLPLARLLRELRERGVEVLVDGAHAPGMLDLDLVDLAPAFYTGNFHKWVCAPKGAAFLFVRADLRNRVRPMAISHGANSPRRDRSRYQLEFAWTGTHDPTPALSVPRAIEFLDGLVEGGWSAIRARNHALVLEGRRRVARGLGLDADAAPESMIGCLASLPLPGASEAPGGPPNTQPLQERLFQRHAVEVPIVPWSESLRLVRLSAHLYNAPAQYDRLAEALRSEL